MCENLAAQKFLRLQYIERFHWSGKPCTKIFKKNMVEALVMQRTETCIYSPFHKILLAWITSRVPIISILFNSNV